MRWMLISSLIVLVLVSVPVGAEEAAASPGPSFESISTLAFGPEGVLFVGDAKAGAVIALKTGDTEPGKAPERFGIPDIETRLAAMLGTRSSEVLIHDLAVNPVSLKIYLSVSRGRARWESRWQLPNELADAVMLVRIDADGEMELVDTETMPWSSLELPNPVGSEKQHSWKKETSLRVDTITDMVFDQGTVWVAGLSNEDFASTMWRLSYPFEGEAVKTTLEVFHGAHGEWETHAPIRTFVPYRFGDTDHLLAAYLCTPLVTFQTEALKADGHVKGKTVAEMGSGNYPLDMVLYEKDGEERLLIANSNLPMMIIDPKDVAGFKGEIKEPVEGYVAGLPYEIRSGTGVQQLDRFGEHGFVMLQRSPGGILDLVSVPVRYY